MAVTLGAEIALPLHFDQATSYGDIEEALIQAGFTNYTIMRNVNPDGSADVQLYVRSESDQNGMREPFPAGETLQNLADAMAALTPTAPAPEPEPAPEP